MALYKLTAGGVLRTSDGANIPNNTQNRDWRGYLNWVAAGNTADPADPPPPPFDPTDPDQNPRNVQTLLKVIADITGTPLAQVRAKFRSLS